MDGGEDVGGLSEKENLLQGCAEIHCVSLYFKVLRESANPYAADYVAITGAGDAAEKT